MLSSRHPIRRVICTSTVIRLNKMKSRYVVNLLSYCHPVVNVSCHPVVMLSCLYVPLPPLPISIRVCPPCLSPMSVPPCLSPMSVPRVCPPCLSPVSVPRVCPPCLSPVSVSCVCRVSVHRVKGQAVPIRELSPTDRQMGIYYQIFAKASRSIMNERAFCKNSLRFSEVVKNPL